MQRRIVSINTFPIYISIEEEFWDCLEEIADNRSTSLHRLLHEIADERDSDLASRIRVFVLSHYQAHRGSLEQQRSYRYH